MHTYASRRTIIASSAVGLSTLVAGRFGAVAQSSQTETAAGGIGWPRAEIENKFGAPIDGPTSNGMLVYANPFLADARLAVRFDGDVADFIDVLLPPTFTNQDDIDWLTSHLVQADSTTLSRFNVRPVDGTPDWHFADYSSEGLSRLGSGAPNFIRTTAFNDDGIVRFTLSLAGADAGSGFASSAESVGVWNTVDEFSSVFGEGTGGGAATGHYEAYWDIAPWSTVKVSSVNQNDQGAVINEISAVSNDGASEEDAVAFSNSILPQSAELSAGYSSYPVPDRAQGWGMSVWQNAETGERLLLFIVGDGLGNETVLQVATVAAQRG